MSHADTSFSPRSLIRRFAEARSGTVATIFGLAVIPMVSFVGLAVDYARAASARSTLQVAIDATTLILARAASGKSQGELAAMGEEVLKAQLAQENLAAPSEIVVSKGDKQVALSAKSAIETTFSRLVGIDTLEIAAASTATFGNRVEVTLVLDNTGSMGGAVAGKKKIDSLKDSSKKLLDILKATAFETDQIRVAIVPFDSQVNIGTSFKGAAWLDFSPDLSAQGKKPWDSKTTPAAWKGCVIDRDQPNDASGSAPLVGVKASMHPAVACDTGKLTAVTPLQDLAIKSGYDTLTAAVAAMTPSGCTNITIGARWGLETLNSSEPFAQTAIGGGVQRFMILLTDGDNTQNRWTNACGAGGKAIDIDTRTKAACAEVKSAGIALYTIGFAGGNETLLQGCATDPSMYSNAASPTALDEVFAKIAQEIAKIRLTS